MSLFDMKDSVKKKILYRQLPTRLFALVSRTTLKSHASLRVMIHKEARIVAEGAYTNGHFTCYAKILNLEVHPDHQQVWLDVETLLLKWFIQAAEQEGVPLCTNTINSQSLGWLDLCMDMGAEEVDMDEQSLSFVDWTGDAADSEKLPKPEEDGTAEVKFMVWKAPRRVGTSQGKLRGGAGLRCI